MWKVSIFSFVWPIIICFELVCHFPKILHHPIFYGVLQKQPLLECQLISTGWEQGHPENQLIQSHINLTIDGADVWEIDATLLKFENKIASGSYGDLWVLVLWLSFALIVYDGIRSY